MNSRICVIYGLDLKYPVDLAYMVVLYTIMYYTVLHEVVQVRDERRTSKEFPNHC